MNVVFKGMRVAILIVTMLVGTDVWADDDSAATAEVITEAARLAALRGDCEALEEMREQLKQLDMPYYRRFFHDDDTIVRCQDRANDLARERSDEQARVAAADRARHARLTSEQSESSPGIALALPIAGMGLGTGTIALALTFTSSSRFGAPGGFLGAGLILVAPSLGQLYTGHVRSIPLPIRLVAFVLEARAIFQWIADQGDEGPGPDKIAPWDYAGTDAQVLTFGAIYVAASIWEIALGVNHAAEKPTVAPLVTATGIGVGLVGRF